MNTSSPIAVVLLNLGGPDDLASVEPFLVKLFSDREIVELPGGAVMQPVLARLIAKVRGPAVRRNYALIGGGSPQLPLTRAQAEALEARLNAVSLGQRYRVYVAMRYSRPSAADVFAAIRAAGITRVLTLTMFPHYSKATTGSSQREFDRVLASPEWRELRAGLDVTHINSYSNDPRYLDALGETVCTALESIPKDRQADTVILFSAHSLPQRFIEAGDPYVNEINATRFGVLARLGLRNQQLLTYQSRTGPVRWLGPGTDEVLLELAKKGVKSVLIVPLSFVSDHIETLYEVDLLFAEVARKGGITGYYRTPALNSHPMFIDALAGLVRDRVNDFEYSGSPTPSVSASYA
jgi:ferrochelatase